MKKADKNLVLEQRQREVMRTYATAAGHTFAGGVLIALMILAESEKEYAPMVACGLTGGWNFYLGLREAADAVRLRREFVKMKKEKLQSEQNKVR